MPVFIESKVALPYTVKPSVEHDGVSLGKVCVNRLHKRLDYLNRSNFPITVCERNGLKFSVPESKFQNNGDVIIRVVYDVPPNYDLDLTDMLDGPEEETSVYGRAFHKDNIYRTLHRDEYVIDYVVKISDIEAGGGALYLENLDITVSLHTFEAVAPHPATVRGKRNKNIEENPELNNLNNFAMSIRIIDNAGRFSPRYLNVSGRVFRIPVSKDPERSDGVYVTTTGEAKGDNISLNPSCEVYTLAEADENLNIYRNYEDALHHGTVSLRLERELQEKQSENKLLVEQLKSENMSRQAIYDEYKLEAEKEQLEIKRKHEAELLRIRDEFRIKEQAHLDQINALKIKQAELEHKRSLEALDRKDVYESRSYERKDTSEFIKFLPAVLTSIAAVASFVLLRQ